MTSGELVDDIIDLTYHLSQGLNSLIHCAGGTGRTGMVLAAVIQNFGVYDPIARIRKVKSTYVETREQEIFLENMPMAIDVRIVKNQPQLAFAIAAEHLIEAYYTHKDEIEKAKKEGEKEQDAGQQLIDVVDGLDSHEEQELRDAYGQIFDLIDHERLGYLNKEELEEWLGLIGAEMDLTHIISVLLGDGILTREMFIKLMGSMVKHNRRSY